MADNFDSFASKYQNIANNGTLNNIDNQVPNSTETNNISVSNSSNDVYEKPEWLNAESKNTPLWMRTLYASIPISAVCVLHGEVHDMQPISIDGNLRPDTTYMALHYIFRDSSFDALLHFDPIKGLRIDCLHDNVSNDQVLQSLEMNCNRDIINSLMSNSSARATNLRDNSTNLDTIYAGLDAVAEAVSLESKYRLAFVIDYTSQVWEENMPDATLKQTMLTCLALANAHQLYNKKPVRFLNPSGNGNLRQPIVWLVDKLDDLPVWLTNGDGIRTIPIPFPDIDTRRQMAELLLASEKENPEFKNSCDRFADATDGLSLRAMFECIKLAESNGRNMLEIEEAVRTYRHGLTENPWQSQRLREKLLNGDSVLKERVKGQDVAVNRVLDIIKRSVQGLTGAHIKNKSSQPRGFLYFAGPTGVGKTEMAKAIAELIFADEQALLRFDMSEFKDDHAKVRLIGAPPGYVGYGGGGELTNAVQKRPHSVILFDEMDKAGKDVYDLFLQILSDGRLTDGQGRTVSFSECLIIFTSNQGIVTKSEELDRLDLNNPEDVMVYDNTVKEAVKDKFENELHRPELLGRIGDNIIVFHPIFGQVAVDLCNKFIDNVLANVRLHVGNIVNISDIARQQIIEGTQQEKYLNKGGRGIAACVEDNLTNPLSRILFNREPSESITVKSLVVDKDGLPSLDCE